MGTGGLSVRTGRMHFLMKHCYAYNTSSDVPPELAAQYLTSISTNPTAVANLAVCIFRPDESSGTIDYRLSVRLLMHTELSGRNLLDTS